MPDPSFEMKTTKTGRIYQLVNMITEEKYIGATFQSLSKRQADRRGDYKRWLTGATTKSKSHKLYSSIKKYGWDAFRLELLKKVEVKNRAELNHIEGEFIRKHNTYVKGLNGNISNRSMKEYMTAYNEIHREKRNEQMRNHMRKKHNYKKFRVKD